MLRVNINRRDLVETWELEGKLCGDWAKELERCWRESSAQLGVTIQVHLKAVSYIDASGKLLLAEMHERGVEIKGCGCMAQALIEDILRNAGGRESQGANKKILAIMLFAVCALGGNANLSAKEKSTGPVIQNAKRRARFELDHQCENGTTDGKLAAFELHNAFCADHYAGNRFREDVKFSERLLPFSYFGEVVTFGRPLNAGAGV